MRHLLAVCDADEVGGAEIWLGELLAGLTPRWRVTIAGHNRQVLRAVADHSDVGHVVIPRLRTKQDLRNIPAAVRLIRKVDPTVIHLNKSEPGGQRYLHLLSRALGRPTVSTVHALNSPGSAMALRLTRFLARHGGPTVTVAPRSAVTIDEMLDLEAGTTLVIESTVSTSRADTPFRRKDEGSLTVGVLARLSCEKRIDTVMHAIAVHPELRLVIGGDGPDRERLEGLTHTRGIGDRSTFLGWVDPSEFFDHVDVLVSASENENAPRSILEAHAHGVPVLARAAGGVADLISHEYDGIVANDDVELWRELERLRSDPDRHRRLAHGAACSARTRPDVASMAVAYQNVYQQELM